MTTSVKLIIIIPFNGNIDTKKLICIFSFNLSIFSLSSCSVFGMVNESVKFSTTKCEEFLDVLEIDDYNNAKELLHLDGEIDKNELKNYILALEQTYNIDFSGGCEITRTLSSFYNIEGDAKIYESIFMVEISSKELYLYFNYLENTADEGINAFYFVDENELN